MAKTIGLVFEKPKKSGRKNAEKADAPDSAAKAEKAKEE